MEKKLDDSNSTKNLSEQINVDKLVIAEKQDIPFQCEECYYTTTSNQGLNIHIERQQNIIEQIYVIDDIFHILLLLRQFTQFVFKIKK